MNFMQMAHSDFNYSGVSGVSARSEPGLDQSHEMEDKYEKIPFFRVKDMGAKLSFGTVNDNENYELANYLGKLVDGYETRAKSQGSIVLSKRSESQASLR